MPTSVYYNLTAICELIDLVSPSSMLDVGVGNGRIGFLARDILDVMHQRDQWKKKIEGIEVFPDYIQDHQRAIYNTIHIGDALEVIDTLGHYDLIYLGDVLEHFEKEDGWALLDKVANHTNEFIGVALPLGESWEQGSLFGNSYEEHKAVWYHEDLQPVAAKEWLFRREGFPDECGYGLFLIDPHTFRHFRARSKGDRLFDEGREAEAISLLIELSESGPANILTDYQLTDYLVKVGMQTEAIAILEKCCHNFPDEEEPKEFLENLRSKSLGK